MGIEVRQSRSRNQMTDSTVSRKSAAPKGRPTELRRAEQQRAQETRSAILNAALTEFASRGFEAASIRSIADRIGLQHALITYHFRTKDILWQAVAEHVFERIQHSWKNYLTDEPPARATDRVKLVYQALFRFTVDFPEFHRFMLQEFLGYSPRLQWLADTVLKPLINWLLPQIHAAQDEGSLPRADPILIHYLLISLTSTLSGFGPEMQVTSNVSASDPAVVDAYWKMVEELIFNRPSATQDSGKTGSPSGKAGRRARVADGVKNPE
ncbi:TetR/AcrR family transcriptional regulator [Paraburkholderia susongensis]|uniref:Transcriptional regulator, TetR family n=1 Tax=Paraburkholderia susongensis TaxID=1515439 RepID=A0A1X7L8R0_9BURK|nr:TetR/AcrR family transcriptional regulator [Paraburkholderia susongensis]SMG50125.1 transcriptional regulator, TetR family [Paraburkholderia susongensis]